MNKIIVTQFSYTARPTRPMDFSESIVGLMVQAQMRLIELSTVPGQTQQAKDEIQIQLNKIQSLAPIIIPTGDGNELTYYSLADNAGGVTEKTCLIDEETLRRTLQMIQLATTHEDVIKNKVKMNAMLKHPKADKDTEVQREGIGLEISRLLGFSQVTNCTLVDHDTGSGRHPCLFIPFDKMELLTDYVDNFEGMNGLLKPNDGDEIEDFGKYSAFFMVCSDSDFMGKHCQNKGLIDENGVKKLYIFDQVFMTDNNLGFDIKFNLVSKAFLSNLPNVVSRHFMGRNKSVINDSYYEERIKGALHLLTQAPRINNLFENISKANQPASSDPKVASIVMDLQKDAIACNKSFNARVEGIKTLLPIIRVGSGVTTIDTFLTGVNKELNATLLSKAMLLNSLLNKPVLFDQSGHPLRAPTFLEAQTSVKQVSFEGDQVTIGLGRLFGPPISADKKAILQEQGFTVSSDGHSATISAINLFALNENNFFKEQQNKVDMEHNYISQGHLGVLAKNYNVEISEKSYVLLIAQYVNASPYKKFTFLKAFNTIDLKITNQGFLKHVKQCFLFAAAQEIIKTQPEKGVEFSRCKIEGNLEDFVKLELTLAIEKDKLQLKESSKAMKSNLQQIMSDQEATPKIDKSDEAVGFKN